MEKKEILSLDEIKRCIGEVAPLYDVKKVSLFGSYARGTMNSESDIDLLVEFSDAPKKPITLFTVIGFQQDVQDKVGKNVDVVELPISEKSLIIIDKEVLLYGNVG